MQVCRRDSNPSMVVWGLRNDPKTRLAKQGAKKNATSGPRYLPQTCLHEKVAPAGK